MESIDRSILDLTASLLFRGFSCQVDPCDVGHHGYVCNLGTPLGRWTTVGREYREVLRQLQTELVDQRPLPSQFRRCDSCGEHSGFITPFNSWPVMMAVPARNRSHSCKENRLNRRSCSSTRFHRSMPPRRC